MDFIAGLADGYRGFQQGEQQELKRQQGLADAKFTGDQRAYQAGQQQRTVEAQGRADELRLSNARIPTSVTEDRTTTPAAPADGVGPVEPPSLQRVSRQTTRGEQLRALADNERKAGNMEKYFQASDEAFKSDWADSAKKISEIETTSAGKPLVDFVKSAADAFTNDPGAGRVDNVQQNPDGSVSFDVANQSSGQKQTKTVKTPAELSNMLRAHYSPDVFAQMQAANRKQMFERENEQFKITAKGNEDRKTKEMDNNSPLTLARVKAQTAAAGLSDAKSRVAAAEAKTKSEGQPSREERLRYTTLYTEAGRRLGEAQRTLAQLQKDPLFSMNAKKENSQEAQQLSELRSSISAHSEERTLYQGMLAGSQSTAKPTRGLGSATPAAAPAASASGDYSKLWTK